MDIFSHHSKFQFALEKEVYAESTSWLLAENNIHNIASHVKNT